MQDGTIFYLMEKLQVMKKQYMNQERIGQKENLVLKEKDFLKHLIG